MVLMWYIVVYGMEGTLVSGIQVRPLLNFSDLMKPLDLRGGGERYSWCCLVPVDVRPLQWVYLLLNQNQVLFNLKYFKFCILYQLLRNLQQRGTAASIFSWYSTHWGKADCGRPTTLNLTFQGPSKSNLITHLDSRHVRLPSF